MLGLISVGRVCMSKRKIDRLSEYALNLKLRASRPSSDLAIDNNFCRLLVNGFSSGPQTAWHLAALRENLWCAIVDKETHRQQDHGTRFTAPRGTLEANGSAFARGLPCCSSLRWNDHMSLLAPCSPSRKDHFAAMRNNEIGSCT